MNKDWALTQARDTFLSYAIQHKEKGKTEKATSNYLMALKMDWALTQMPTECDGEPDWEEYQDLVCGVCPTQFKEVARLLHLLRYGPRHKCLGVCANCVPLYSLCGVDVSDFPGFTGDYNYPIELPGVYEAEGKWEGERRTLRFNFVKFLIKAIAK